MARRRNSVTDKLRSLGRRSGVYVLSLPERTVRSVSALAGGLVRETAVVVLPIGVRRGRLYRNLVDVTLQFLIEKIGQVDPASAPSREELAENFLARRAAGNGSSSWDCSRSGHRRFGCSPRSRTSADSAGI
jgi:hypothetical protein